MAASSKAWARGGLTPGVQRAAQAAQPPALSAISDEPAIAATESNRVAWSGAQSGM